MITTEQILRDRIAELEKALDLLLRHQDCFELRDAFKNGLEVLGRDTYHKN